MATVAQNPKEIGKVDKILVLVVGPPLIGKTTLARNVESQLGIRYIDVDNVRAELYRNEQGKRFPPAQEKERMESSYKEAYRRARQSLDSGKSVMVVATHSREFYHQLAIQTAKDAGEVPIIAVNLDTTKINDLAGFLKERLKSREEEGDTTSNVKGDGALEHALSVYQRYELIRGEDVHKMIAIDPNLSLEEQTLSATSELKKHLRVEKQDGTAA